MMLINISDRYIIKTVLGVSLLATLVMLTLDIIFNFITELEDLGEGDYSLVQVALFLFLTTPRRIFEILPMALLVGGLLGMGALASSSELIVMRASGTSVLRLTTAALCAGLILSLGGLLLGEFIAPYTEKIAQELRSAALYSGRTIRSGKGFWARDGDQFIHVQVVLTRHNLSGVSVYRVDENAQLHSLMQARSARYTNGAWLLQEVKHHHIALDHFTIEQQTEVLWPSSINPDTLDILAADPEDLSMRDLMAYIGYLKNNALDARHYQLAFWNKVFSPVTHLAMLMIAMPFAFTRQRTSGAGQRLMIGVMLGLLFYLLSRMLSNWVLLSNLPTALGAALPPLLFFAVGTLTLRRLR